MFIYDCSLVSWPSVSLPPPSREIKSKKQHMFAYLLREYCNLAHISNSEFLLCRFG